MQGYYMPIYDNVHHRVESSTGLMPSTSSAIYQTASGTPAAVLPVAYPTAQIAAPNGTAFYSGQLIYSSEQFSTPNNAIGVSAAPAAATAAASSQVQQIPLATYPIGYPYTAYNGRFNFH